MYNNYYVESIEFNDFLELFEDEHLKTEKCILCGKEIRVRESIETEVYICEDCDHKAITHYVDEVLKQNDLIERISNYIVKTVQKESILSGFQYVVSYANIQEQFAQEIDGYIYNKVLDNLSIRKEVADVQEDTDGFDVVLYTDYAPNYNKKDYEE